MNHKINLTVVTVATFLLVATYVSAQMPLSSRLNRSTNPYNPNSSMSMGHALDRNPQMGSGGRNVGGPSRNNAGYGPGELTDINRTRGLGYFHGNAPTINDSFNNNSSVRGSVAQFEQRSVNLSDVVRGGEGTYRPQSLSPYYNQMETVTTPGMVRRDAVLNVAPIAGNSNVTQDMVQYNNQTMLTEDMTTPQYSQLASLIYLQGGQYAEQVANSAPGTLPAPTSAQDILQLQRALIRSGYNTGAFGLTNPYDQASLTNEISQFDESEEQTNQQNNMIDARIDNGPIMPDNSIATVNQNPITGRPAVRDDFINRDQLPQNPSDVNNPTNPPLPADSTTPGFDQDAFSELRAALQQKAAEERNAIEKQRKEEEEKEAAELDKVIDKNAAKTAEDEELNDLSLEHDKALRKQMLVTLTKKNDVVIKDLAGNSKDLFNRYMNNAKNALAKGRYYVAAQQYELAAMTKSKNPLPWLGGSLAKFAAGEWSVAGFRLQTAFEMYPQLMNVKLELKTLLPEMDVEQQLNLLENWLMALEPQPNVLLLAAYMQYQAGNFAGARRHAEAILKISTKIPPIIKEVAESIMKKTAPEKGK